MSHTDFRYPDVLDRFGLTHCLSRLFDEVPPLPPVRTLLTSPPLATLAHTELARSAWLVGPLLADVWGRYDGKIGMYAGEVFGTLPEGAIEPCDFFACRSCQHMGVIAPPVRLVVSVGTDGTGSSLGRCIATAVTVQRYNRVAGREGDEVFGCATDGLRWRFFRLAESHLTFDIPEYDIEPPDRILGILTHILGPVPVLVPAAA